MKKGKKAILALLLTGSVLAGGVGTMTILAENGKDTPPAMGESVPLRNLVIKFLAIPELEPNRYTKSGSGKFAPEEMEKGLLIGAEMKYGPGNPEGMMAPLKHSLADIAADLTFDTGTGEIVIKYNDLVLTMSEGGSEAVLEKNGEKETLTIPEGLEPYFVEIKGETTPEGDPYMVCYLPVKFTAEALGANVSWDDDMHRLIMAFALYYTDSAVEPVINEKSEYTTKKMEKDSYSYDKLSKIASSSNATPASTSKTKAKDDLIQAAVSVVNEKYQNDDGGWGKTNKDYDLLSDSFAELYGHAYSTFDNGATGGHIKFLARLLRVARENPESFAAYEDELAVIEKGFWKAVNYMIEAQTDEGGWPQYYPYGVGYFKKITYNDNAMTTIMNLIYAMTHEQGLMDSELCKDFAWVREEMADGDSNPYVEEYGIEPEEIQNMWDKALEFTLNSQIEVDGQLTGWGQQYDPETNEPAQGRGFELPSISTSESDGIMKVLTNIVEPDERVVNAVESYVHWTSQIGVEGFKSVNVSDRTRELGKDRRYVYTGTSDKSYGRFYGLDTTGDYYESLQDKGLDGFYAIYAGRDGVAKLDHNVGGHERRSGYSFIQTGIQDKAEKRYKQWQDALENYTEIPAEELKKEEILEEELASPSDAEWVEDILDEDSIPESSTDENIEKPELATSSCAAERQ